MLERGLELRKMNLQGLFLSIVLAAVHEMPGQPGGGLLEILVKRNSVVAVCQVDDDVGILISLLARKQHRPRDLLISWLSVFFAVIKVLFCREILSVCSLCRLCFAKIRPSTFLLLATSSFRLLHRQDGRVLFLQKMF